MSERLKNFLRKILPRFILSAYHYWIALWGAVVFGFPSKKLKVIGVTGTNGKTTTVYLLSRILEEFGYKVASASSIEFKIKDKSRPNTFKTTMPGRAYLQEFLKKASEEKCDFAVLEVTSQGVEQHRHRFIDFEMGVFTNLSWEHIEWHGGFENYRESKGKFFKSLKGRKIAIVNLDDHNAEYFLSFPSLEKYGYGIINQKTEYDLKPDSWQLQKDGLIFRLKNIDFKTKLIGRFNLYNALASASAALALDVPMDKIKSALEKIEGVPGRIEIVVDEPFKVVIDYAHTPDALGKLLQNLRDIYNSKMICIIGAAGGGRDKWKRPVLGKVACHYCENIIITNEDPYDEPPEKIIEEVACGCQLKIPEKILDRRRAIQRAFRLAKSGDIVVIAGKGSEPWICVSHGQKIPWDDRQVVKEEIKKI